MSNESKAPNALLWVILLAVLIEPLALALILDREAPAAPVPPPDPALSDARPFPVPKPGVSVVPDAVKRYPRNKANVDAWVRHELDRNARGEDDDPTLFFHRTTSEILAEFGVPDVASESEAGVRWQYRSSDGENDLLIDFHAGRVYRVWF